MAWTTPRTFVQDELETPAIFNMHLRDNLNALVHPIVVKSVDEAVTSSTVLQDDDALLMALAINEMWYVRCGLWVVDASGGVANLKAAFTFPSGTVSKLRVASDDTAGVNVDRYFETSGASQTFAGRSAGSWIPIEGPVLCGGTAGNLQLQWCQNTSNASAVTVKKGSFIFATKLF